MLNYKVAAAAATAAAFAFCLLSHLTRDLTRISEHYLLLGAPLVFIDLFAGKQVSRVWWRSGAPHLPHIWSRTRCSIAEPDRAGSALPWRFSGFFVYCKNVDAALLLLLSFVLRKEMGKFMANFSLLLEVFCFGARFAMFCLSRCCRRTIFCLYLALFGFKFYFALINSRVHTVAKEHKHTQTRRVWDWDEWANKTGSKWNILSSCWRGVELPAMSKQ